MSISSELRFGDYYIADKGPPYFVGAVKSVFSPKIELVTFCLDTAGDYCSINSKIIHNPEYGCLYKRRVPTSAGSGALLIQREAYTNLDIIIPVSSEPTWQPNIFPNPKLLTKSYRNKLFNVEIFLESKYANLSIIGIELLKYWGLQIHLDYKNKLFIINNTPE